MTFRLRSYQREAIDGIPAWWERQVGNPLVVAPTGSGKSVMIAIFVRETREAWPGTRFLIVTHVKELIEQNYCAMLTAWPTAPVGLYSAGLGMRTTGQPITFCGIQSVHTKAALFGHIDLMIVDEAHLLPRRADSMYGRFISALRQVNPHMKVVGFTATPYRLDSGRLDQGEDRIFDGIAYDIGIGRLVDEGHLAPLVSKATATALDVSGVKRRGGEFVEAELQRAVDTESVTAAAVHEILAYGARRRSWLIFCTGVAHAQHVAQEIRQAGLAAACVHGEMPAKERDARIAAFKRGELRALTNANILTTGFDHPPVDLIALLRPTLSTGLYVQMLGRGMRTAPGKENCLVLDFAGNVRRHGPVDAVSVREPGEGDGEGVAPTKVCPNCQSIVHAAVRECPDCGEPFPPPEVDHKLEATASAAAVMTNGASSVWLPVTSWHFRRHEKPGGRPTLRVEYRCGLTLHKEWVCLEHDGYPGRKAKGWWRLHGGREPLPGTVDEALGRTTELRLPVDILVRQNGMFFEVLSRRFVRAEAAA